MERVGARRLRLTRRLLALTAAGAAHVAILGLLALSLAGRQARAPEPEIRTPLVGVDLSVPNEKTPPPKRRRQTPRRRSPVPTPAAPQQTPDIAPFPAAAPSVASRNATGDEAQAAANGEDARVRGALRSLAGCDYGDLSRSTEAERDRCRQRLDQSTRQARALPVGPADPRKRALLEHELRVDEAFRAYRRSPNPDDYPGLRTFIPALRPLFGDEPRPVGDGPH